MITIGQYPDSARAELDKSILESAGIRASLADENSVSAGYGSVLGGVRLQVEEADADRARQVLKEHYKVGPLPDDFVPPEEQTGAEPKLEAKKMNDSKNVVVAVVVTSLVVLLGVSLFRNPRTADTSYSERAREAYDERVRRAEAIMTAQEQTHQRYVEILNKVEENERKAEENQRRFEKILATWEQQQQEYQKYLDSLNKTP